MKFLIGMAMLVCVVAGEKALEKKEEAAAGHYDSYGGHDGGFGHDHGHGHGHGGGWGHGDGGYGYGNHNDYVDVKCTFSLHFLTPFHFFLLYL